MVDLCCLNDEIYIKRMAIMEMVIESLVSLDSFSFIAFHLTLHIIRTMQMDNKMN